MDNLLTIKQFADICKTTSRTIRFYGQKGLLKPVKVDQFTKYRYYSPSQVRDFLLIKLLQSFDVPLSQIKPTVPSLDGRLSLMKKGIEEMEKQYLFLKRIKNFMFEKKSLEKLLKKKMVGPYRLFVVRIENGRYDQINSYIKELQNTAKSLGINVVPHRQITFYLSPLYNPKNTQLEIALICKNKKKKINLPRNHHFLDYPKRSALIYEYVGPYEYLTFVYQKIDQMFLQKKMKVSSPVFEEYVRGPLGRYSKYDYLTIIGYPI